jgi:hypothetical protein
MYDCGCDAGNSLFSADDLASCPAVEFSSRVPLSVAGFAPIDFAERILNCPPRISFMDFWNGEHSDVQDRIFPPKIESPKHACSS